MANPTNQSTTVVSNLPAPPYNTQWCDRDGNLTRGARSWLDLMYNRIGGSSGDVIYTASDFSNADATTSNQLYAAFQAELDATNQIVFSINEQTQDTIQPWIDDTWANAAIQQVLSTPASQLVISPTSSNSNYYPILSSVTAGTLSPVDSISLFYNPASGVLTSGAFTSTVAIGTPPLVVTSTTPVANLYAGLNAPLTTGSSILYGNGSGGFSPVSLGTGLSFTSGVLTNSAPSTGGTVTSVSGTGTVSGLTLTGTVTSTGSLTLGGTLSLTSSNITTGLGYTPYNSTNPSGYLSSITSSQVTTALGYTPYNSSNPAGYNTGTVTSASVTTANGISGTVATATTTPAITLSLGAITPTSVVASGTVTGTQLISNIATGTAPLSVTSTTPVPNLNIGGNAATATNMPYSGLTGTVPTWNQNTTGTASNVTTNANLTGPITSVGNATSIASQTGTGSTFVVQNSPTLTTPNIGVATGTSLSLSSTNQPLYVNSSNSSNLKITMADAGTTHSYLGCNSTYSFTVANSSDTITTFSVDQSGDGNFAGGVTAPGTISGGTLVCATSNPGIFINDTSGTSNAGLVYESNGMFVWNVLKGAGATGAYGINRYVSGSYVDTPLTISNTTGLVSITDGLTVSGTSLFTGTRTYTVPDNVASSIPTIASAATIAPTTPILFVSGTTPISTITAPAGFTNGGQITIIPTGVFTTVITGNIALVSTAVVSKALIMTYAANTAKWYPSY